MTRSPSSGAPANEWIECDLGGQLAGAVTVGAYPSLTRDQLQYVLAHSDARVVFVDSEEERSKIDAVRKDCPLLEHVVVWDPAAAKNGAVAMHEVLATMPDDPALEARAREIDPDACAVIVYTSGTTGPPKGAMISHANILTVLREPLSLGLEQKIEEEYDMKVERWSAPAGRPFHAVSWSWEADRAVGLELEIGASGILWL